MCSLTEANCLPYSEIPAGRVVARIGLISDTHMPERCVAFPESTFNVLRGVDLILHAGDVGKLWVLDRLSTVAPVVAVHGNDDAEEARRELPYQQVVSIAGQRILLWHSHYPDPAEEKASRGGSWHQILARQAERGRSAGARVVVFGHIHVPVACRYEGILLVNPGALASGNVFTRQDHQTVAVLFICDGGALSTAHVDLAAPERVFVSEIDWEAGFEVAAGRFQSLIVEPGLSEAIGELGKRAYSDPEALRDAMLPLCYPCWAGEKQYMARAELLKQIEDSKIVAPDDREKVVGILSRKAS